MDWSFSLSSFKAWDSPEPYLSEDKLTVRNGTNCHQYIFLLKGGHHLPVYDGCRYDFFLRIDYNPPHFTNGVSFSGCPSPNPTQTLTCKVDQFLWVGEISKKEKVRKSITSEEVREMGGDEYEEMQQFPPLRKGDIIHFSILVENASLFVGGSLHNVETHHQEPKTPQGKKTLHPVQKEEEGEKEREWVETKYRFFKKCKTLDERVHEIAVEIYLFKKGEGFTVISYDPLLRDLAEQWLLFHRISL